MTRIEIKKLIMLILGQVDYDMMKSLDPETAEEPDYASQKMEEVIDVVAKHLQSLEQKKTKSKNSSKKKSKRGYYPLGNRGFR